MKPTIINRPDFKQQTEQLYKVLTPDEVLQRNAEFERQCIEQARVELAKEKQTSGVGYIGRLITRAQEIKMQRKANGEQSS